MKCNYFDKFITFPVVLSVLVIISLLLPITGEAASVTIWPETTIPSTVDSGPDSAVELGVRFQSDTNGYITGIRFYKASTNTGTHIGNLWSVTGSLLATATFTGESASGWQQVNFSTPVAISANTIYTASYHTSVAHFSVDRSYFTNTGVDRSPLHVPADTVSGSNGVYAYGATSSFPGQSWNSCNYWVDVVFSTSATPDTTPPVVTAFTVPPTATSLTVAIASFTASDDVGVTGYLVTESAVAPPAASGVWSATPQSAYAFASAGSKNLYAWVRDAAGNVSTSRSAAVTVTPSTTNITIWADTAVPGIVDSGPDSALELGVNFQSDVSGFITGIRFYKASSNTGTHVANFWSSTGTLLATATFTGETASGWQQVNFVAPVAISANTSYVASYHASTGHFSVDRGYFSGKGVDNAPLHAPADGVSGSNGVFAYGSTSSFPSQSWNGCNYWVDVVFSSSSTPDTIPPVVTVFTIPAAAASLSVAINGFTATDDSRVTGYLVNESATAPLATAVGWISTPPTSYTFTSAGSKILYAWARDAAGNVSVGKSAAVVVTYSTTNVTIWQNTTVPAIVDGGPDSPVELGLRFQTDVSGFISGVRFYKASANTGTHVANLWTATGTLLASATFADETASGWQQVNFSVPVAISANTGYIASYHSGAGHFSVNRGYFAGAGVDNTPLHAPADSVSNTNGVFAYGAAGTFPGQSWNSSNYWVDVVFTTTPPPDTTPPTVTTFTVPSTSAALSVSITGLTATDDIGVTGYLVNETASAPLATAGGWSTSAPLFYVFTTAGSKTLYAWSKDSAGNVSTGRSAAVTITLPDTTPPTVTTFTVPSTSATLSVLITTLTATDDTGVTGYLINESATAPLAMAGGWSATAPTTYTFISTGSKTLYAWARDAAGNVSASRNAVVTIMDSTAPTVTAFTVPAAVATLSVSITTLTATDDTGVTGYLITESATAPLTTAGGWSATAPTSYAFTSTGSKTLYAWARDAAGNVSVSRSAAVSVTDTTAPTVTAFTVPATVTTLSVSITTFTATDDTGVTGYLVTETATAPLATAGGWSATAPTTYTFASTGSKTLYAWGRDAAGNVSASRSAVVSITDTTAPAVITFTIPAAANTLTVSITSFTATDNIGVTGYLVTESATAPLATAGGWSATATTTYTFASTGSKTLYAWAKDAAGVVSASRSAAVTVDTTKPAVTVFAIPATATTLSVSITSFTATDNIGVTGYLATESATAPLATDTGWSAPAPVSYTFTSTGSKTLYAWARDTAGNVSTSRSAAVSITDTIRPTVTAFTVPAAATTLTISISSFIATDNIGVTGYLVNESSSAPLTTAAGWSATAPAFYTFTSTGSKTLYAWARDAASYVSTSKSAVVTISDPIAPTVTAFTIPASATTLSILISSLTATDNIGVTGFLVNEIATAPLATAAGWSVTAPTSYTFTTPGSKTLYAWAKDAAANVSTSRSAAVTVTDSAAPTVTAFTIPASATTLSIPITSFSATDNIGVTGYLATESSTAPLATDAGWSITVPTSYTFTSIGSKTLFAWAKDAAGNVSTSRSAAVNIAFNDTTAPSVTAFTIPAAANSLTVSISTFTATDNVAVTGYLVTESATVPLATAAGWSATAPVSYTCSTTGNKTLYAWAKDAVGYISASRSAPVTVDTTRPTVSAFTIPTTATTLSVLISSFTATDNIGVTGYLVTESNTAPLATDAGWSSGPLASFSFETAGNKTLYAWARDAAGNVSTSSSDSVVISLPSGGPILIISSVSSPFSGYYAEILRAEGFNAFNMSDISAVTSSLLASYDVVILGDISLTAAQVTTLTSWVNSGGHLIAMHPDPKLAGLLGLTDLAATISDAYLLVNTASGPGVGIVNQTIQYHGAANLYNLSGAASIATLYATDTNSTSNPAVTLQNVGSQGGQAAAFAFDLARSVVYTHQGNPAWVGQERDGYSPIRPDDLFYGNATSDPKPDWINLNKVSIPQADEQQRLLANLIIQMNLDKKPLPRFWYFPRNLPAVIVMTGDDHGWGTAGSAGRFDSNISASTSGCSVANWECIRSTSYVWPTPAIILSDAQAAAYNASGFEVALHVNTGDGTSNNVTGCANFTLASFENTVSTQLTTFSQKFPSLPKPATNRNHCIAWSDWSTVPLVELNHGIRLDTSYYYYPSYWVADRPGFFTGSGMPMRFTDINGNLIDTYQAATQLTDESGQTYPMTINALLDAAAGSKGYYGAFVANMHTDVASSSESDAIISSAKSHAIPVISSRQLLTWLDGRNGSSYSSLSRNLNSVTLSITAAAGANGLVAMVPLSESQTVSNVTQNGTAVVSTILTVKGIRYITFPAATGSYQVNFTDMSPPVISAFTIPAASSALTVPITSITATDNVAVTGYLVNESGSAPLPTATGWSATVPGSFTFATDGSKILYSWAKDAAGNVSAGMSASVTISVPNISLVQAASNITDSDQNVTSEFPENVTAGNFIVVAVSGWPNLPASPAVTDSQGNTYSSAGAVMTVGGAYSAIYFARNVIGGATAITFNAVNTNSQISMVVAEFSGVNTVSPLDTTAGATGNGTTPSSGIMTPGAAGNLVIGCGTHNTTTVTTAGTGFTMIAIPTEDSHVNQPLAMEYKISNGQQTAATFNLSAGYPWAQNGAIFKYK